MKKNAIGIALMLLMALYIGLSLAGCAPAGASDPAPTGGMEASEALLAPSAKESAPTPTPEPPAPITLRITEIMPSNKAALAAPDGSFPDWLELCNTGDEPVALEGVTLHAGKESCPLGGPALMPGEHRVLFCNGSEGENGLPCKLSAQGGKLVLADSAGRVIDRVEYPEMEADRSFGLLSDGSFGISHYPSPGYPNTEEGYVLFQQSRAAAPSAPVIAEAMVYNRWYLTQKEGDWVELLNSGDQPLELSDFYLSDEENERLLCQLPQYVLAPGERIVLLCGTKGGEDVGFALSSGGEALYLSRSDGSLCDYASLHDIPLGASLGRSDEGGFCFFAEPTPGKPNADGKRFIAERPHALTPDGVYEDVDRVSVELGGAGVIRYTLDGSLPGEDSALYTGPIELRETTVVRAVSFREDCLPSPALSLSFLVNEGHSLPVLSLVCDPADIFGPLGIHSNPTQDWEVPCTVAFFEKNGGFCVDAGLKMHGGTSRFHMLKKSFKLNFKDRYDGQLQYRLFETEVDTFSSLLIRSSQETDGFELRPSTYMRDALIHKVAVRYFPEISSQDCRYCILYINGEYRGIYNLREAHSVDHFAAHFGVSPDNLLHWKGHWGNTIPFDSAYYHAQAAALSDDEDYEELSRYLDLDSVIAWLILEAYNGNVDANSPNMRFYWNGENQKLSYALVDLDMGMFKQVGLPLLLHCGYPYSRVANLLMQNAQFRKLFADRLREAAEGPLSDESFLALIDEFAAELRPEIPRDRALWGGDPEEWEAKVQELRDYVLSNGGRAKLVISTLIWTAGYSQAEMAEYFPGDLWDAG